MMSSFRDPPAWTGLAASIIPPPRRGNLVIEPIDGEVVLIDAAANQMTRLNSTARLVWESCDGRASTRDIAARLAERYDIDFDAALADVEQTIAACAAQNLFSAGAS